MGRLSKAGADLSTRDDEGSTLLHTAVLTNLSVAKELIKMGADINACDKKGRTALHVACECRNAPAIKILIQAGAQINA